MLHCFDFWLVVDQVMELVLSGCEAHRLSPSLLCEESANKCSTGLSHLVLIMNTISIIQLTHNYPIYCRPAWELRGYPWNFAT